MFDFQIYWVTLPKKHILSTFKILDDVEAVKQMQRNLDFLYFNWMSLIVLFYSFLQRFKLIKNISGIQNCVKPKKEMRKSPVFK